jgi:hypothetical protein
VGVSAKSDLDISDWVGGLAGLITFGKFAGTFITHCGLDMSKTNIVAGGGPIIPDLELRVPFPSGSMAHIRGTGLNYYTMKHYGVEGRPSQRKTLVWTNNESIRRAVQREMRANNTKGQEGIEGIAEGARQNADCYESIGRVAASGYVMMSLMAACQQEGAVMLEVRQNNGEQDEVPGRLRL